MGKHVKQQNPRPMPTAARAELMQQGLPQGFFVAGCRGDGESTRDPKAGVHDHYRFVRGDAAALAGRRVMCFVHGYNVTPEDALRSAREFFASLHAALLHDGRNPEDWVFLLFTWPGDTGTLYFNQAQAFAQMSGAALYRLIAESGAQWSIATHSLGAHVALHAAAVLGDRLIAQRPVPRIGRLLLLAASIEDDVFERPQGRDEYHFPEAAFGVESLHISMSRGDPVLALPFLINENDHALGYCGPQSMSPLQSLARRVQELLQLSFVFRVHDFSPSSPTIFNSELHVSDHGGYWDHPAQMNYYVNLLV